MTDVAMRKLQVAFTKVFLSDWIYFIAMLVSERDIFFHYSDDFRIIEEHTEIIHCGRSDHELIKSIKQIQNFLALGFSSTSKSEHHESNAKKMIYKSWF